MVISPKALQPLEALGDTGVIVRIVEGLASEAAVPEYRGDLSDL